jgi:hypothetical protein
MRPERCDIQVARSHHRYASAHLKQVRSANQAALRYVCLITARTRNVRWPWPTFTLPGHDSLSPARRAPLAESRRPRQHCRLTVMHVHQLRFAEPNPRIFPGPERNLSAERDEQLILAGYGHYRAPRGPGQTGGRSGQETSVRLPAQVQATWWAKARPAAPGRLRRVDLTGKVPDLL